MWSRKLAELNELVIIYFFRFTVSFSVQVCVFKAVYAASQYVPIHVPYIMPPYNYHTHITLYVTFFSRVSLNSQQRCAN